MRSGVGRRRLLAALVVIFGVQTALVYSDETGYVHAPLSPEAARGQEIWHANNCQSCHQLYGFGGFLGPDLTNAMDRISPDRLESVLVAGAAQMPPFHMNGEEIAAIGAFLAEVGATGLGQPEPLLGDPSELLDDLVAALAPEGRLNGTQEIGRSVVKDKQCVGCHLPNQQSSHKAPDLTELVEVPGPEGILFTVEKGRLQRGMPAFSLVHNQQTGLLEFLHWLNDSGDAIRAGFDTNGARDRSIPWFEYR